MNTCTIGNEINEVEFGNEYHTYSGGHFQFYRKMIIRLKNGLSYNLTLVLSGMGQTWDCQTYRFDGYFKTIDAIPQWLKNQLKTFLNYEWQTKNDSHLKRSILSAIASL